MTDAYVSAELSAEQHMVVMMLSVSPRHVAVELSTIESVIGNERHTFGPFSPFKDEQWWRKVREAAESLERSGFIRNDGHDRYMLNDRGFSALQSGDFTHADRQRLTGLMTAAVQHQSDHLSMHQRAVRDMQRGRFPRFR